MNCQVVNSCAVKSSSWSWLQEHEGYTRITDHGIPSSRLSSNTIQTTNDRNPLLHVH